MESHTGVRIVTAILNSNGPTVRVSCNSLNLPQAPPVKLHIDYISEYGYPVRIAPASRLDGLRWACNEGQSTTPHLSILRMASTTLSPGWREQIDGSS